ncbi:MAG: hypothetical protein ACTSQ0_02545 [Candidatus Heimdallarchaeota archaeon]
MKKTNKNFLKIAILLLFTLIIVPATVLQTHAYDTRIPDVYNMSFIHAEYLDADEDGVEDDTRFLVDVYFNPLYFDGSLIRLDCYFEIILPSGITFAYRGFIKLASDSCIIQFDVYNTVTEPGWYTINFDSSVKIQMIKYTCFCTTIFDPPTEAPGGGGPTIDF